MQSRIPAEPSQNDPKHELLLAVESRRRAFRRSLANISGYGIGGKGVAPEQAHSLPHLPRSVGAA